MGRNDEGGRRAPPFMPLLASLRPTLPLYATCKVLFLAGPAQPLRRSSFIIRLASFHWIWIRLVVVKLPPVKCISSSIIFSLPANLTKLAD
ncbi:hypothetical protein Y032_0020g5 [Ancylostoma ceylanicum]|uniref:Uncharacterized protein n=1 Tax=Ancylostoma ceylanicum TaxID=53326 RepID=A0A016V1R6_9BILA|nr:hypothetical protein Y032_0020g5 [Ancylostoma ceylanicum]